MGTVMLMFILSTSVVALLLICFALVSIAISDFIDGFGEDDDERK